MRGEEGGRWRGELVQLCSTKLMFACVVLTNYIR